VAPIPWRASKAEVFLRGKKIDSTAAQQAGTMAVEGARPLKDNIYKVKMAQDLVRRGLLESV
jgi:xanthine dehydrogenase YagS FAD-binding subunit